MVKTRHIAQSFALVAILMVLNIFASLWSLSIDKQDHHHEDGMAVPLLRIPADEMSESWEYDEREDMPFESQLDYFCNTDGRCEGPYVEERNAARKQRKYNRSTCFPPWPEDSYEKPTIEIVSTQKKNNDSNRRNSNSQWDDCKLGRMRYKMGKWKTTIRKPLPEEIASHLIQDDVHIKTNLRILTIGDSVAMQLFQMLRESMGLQSEKLVQLDNSLDWNDYPNVGYGVVNQQLGLFGVKNLLLHNNENKTYDFQGWNCSTVQRMIQALSPNDANETKPFDVVIIQIPHRWLNLKQVYLNNIYETLQLTQELFGYKKAIMVNMPFITKIGVGERELWLQKNSDLQKLIDLIRPNSTLVPPRFQQLPRYTLPGVDAVVVLDLARVVNDAMDLNAKRLNMTKRKTKTNNSYFDHYSYLDTRMAEGNPKHPPAVAHMCHSLPEKKNTKCLRSSLTLDGFHLCRRTFQSHIVAGLACLMQCLYDDVALMYTCERNCNQQYMSFSKLKKKFVPCLSGGGNLLPNVTCWGPLFHS